MTAMNVVVLLAFYVNSRMRIALVPELIIFAGLSIEAIVRWVQRRQWMPLGVSAVAIVGAAFLCARPIPSNQTIIRADDYLVAYVNYTYPEMKKALAAGDRDRAGLVIDNYLEHEPADFAELDASHHPTTMTDQAVAQIFAAAHVREAKLLAGSDTATADWHMKRAHDLMAAAGKPTPF